MSQLTDELQKDFDQLASKIVNGKAHTFEQYQLWCEQAKFLSLSVSRYSGLSEDTNEEGWAEEETHS